jgi:Cd2+/Zn2+-exporting ATPase
MLRTIKKAEFKLTGLHCANCGAKIERVVKNAPGVLSASLNFIGGTLILELSEDFTGDVHKIIEGIVHKFEPDVEVEMKNAEQGIIPPVIEDVELKKHDDG